MLYYILLIVSDPFTMYCAFLWYLVGPLFPLGIAGMDHLTLCQHELAGCWMDRDSEMNKQSDPTLPGQDEADRLGQLLQTLQQEVVNQSQELERAYSLVNATLIDLGSCQENLSQVTQVSQATFTKLNQTRVDLSQALGHLTLCEGLIPNVGNKTTSNGDPCRPYYIVSWGLGLGLIILIGLLQHVNSKFRQLQRDGHRASKHCAELKAKLISLETDHLNLPQLP